MTSLAQIVAALSVTYQDGALLIWLNTKRTSGLSMTDLIERGRIAEVAHAVRLIGDADPDDFTITERAPVATKGTEQ